MGIAADTYAQISREMFDDWQNRFYPKQKELMEKSQSGELLNEQLGRVDENAASSMKAASLGEANKMARYGVDSGTDENQNAKLALSTAAAKNGLRDHERDRSMKVLSGAGLGIKDYAQPR
ncbi:hypothetical protein [Enterovibrio sp. 27052020O]|uniref:hypothetical protein n=1 Tax=Enterovibrio sp. 27052020O TaxID=3241166 RepID=UPI00388D324C